MKSRIDDDKTLCALVFLLVRARAYVMSSSSSSPAIPSVGNAPGTTIPRELCREQMGAAWHSLSYPYVRMCLNAILDRVLQVDAIVALRGTARLELSEQFDNYLRTWMVPFVRDAFDAIQAFGIVPIAFKAIESGDIVPYVPRYPSWTASVHSERGLAIYRFFWNNEVDRRQRHQGLYHGSSLSTNIAGRYDPSVYIAHDFGYDPDLDGNLRSNMASIASEIYLATEMIDGAVTAENILSMPPIFLERDTAIDKQVQQTHKFGYYSGSADVSTAKYNEELRYERSARDVEALSGKLAAYRAITGQRHESDPSTTLEDDRSRVRLTTACDERGKPALWSRQFSVPATRRVVSAQLPVRNTNLVGQLEFIQHTICGILSVPRGALASQSTVRAGVEASSEALQQTIRVWSSRLSRLMTLAYEHAFGQRDFRNELRLRVNQRARRHANGVTFTVETNEPKPLVDERDFFVAHERTRIVLNFDLAPSNPPQELDDVYNRGLIEWTPYRDRRLAQLDIPRGLGRKSDPLSREERTALLSGGAKRKDGDSPSSSSSSSSSSTPAKKSRTASK